MDDLFEWIAFVVASLAIVYISRRSLFKPRSHGFYRFFAWECILALILLNLDGWFREPWAWHQVLSWAMLLVSFIPLVFGVQSLVARGKATAQREGEEQLLAFEKTTALVTDGIYRYIRHPLYSSLLLLAWGAFLKAPGWLGGLLLAGATLALVATARADEAECKRFFGEAYGEYMKRTKMFVLYIV
ncbi:isoprenylcysteine carboxylmethyltransferase family protein [bacterium]|nr:MAG: isoprenylcysteine carboxylmethyltransferase family protein [bacterium]